MLKTFVKIFIVLWAIEVIHLDFQGQIFNFLKITTFRTHHLFKIVSPKFGPEVQNTLVKILIGGDVVGGVGGGGMFVYVIGLDLQGAI